MPRLTEAKKTPSGKHRVAVVVGQHANAEPHRKFMTWLKSAGSDKIMDLSVKAGVYTSDYELAVHYRTTKSSR